MKHLYQQTCKRSEGIRRRGFQLVEIWECEFKRQINEDQRLKQFVENHKAEDPIVARDALRGGRTNAACLLRTVSGTEQIKYVDFTRYRISNFKGLILSNFK